MTTRAKGGDLPHLSLIAASVNRKTDAGAPRRIGPEPHLDAADIDELRCAIEQSLCEGEVHDHAEGDVDAELRKSLRVACMKARLQRVRAEHLLIDVKQLWARIPRMLDTRTDQRLSEIITACIDEYYGRGTIPPL